MPPVRPLAPAPTFQASNTATDLLGAIFRSHAAAARPVNPPPMTAKSRASGSARSWAGMKSICQGVAPQLCGLEEKFISKESYRLVELAKRLNNRDAAVASLKPEAAAKL